MITAAITAFCEMVKQGFATLQSNIEHKLEGSVIKDKKDLKKATDVAEKIILLMDRYKNFLTEKDLKEFEKLKKKFLKYN